MGSTVDGVAILDAKTGKHVRSPIVTGAPVHDLAFSSDSRTAYLAMDQGGIQKLALPAGTLTQLDSQCCPWFLSIDKRTNRLLVSYQNGGPGGREGHDVVGAFDLKTETLVDRLSGPPLVGGPISNSSERDIALIDGWDACKTAKYDHAGCPDIGRSVFHVVRPSNLQTVVRTVVLEPILGAGPIFSDGRLALLSNESLSVLDLSRGNILERLDPLLCGMPVVSDKKIFVPRRTPPAILVIEPEDQSCSTHPPSLANAFTGDGVTHDVVGVMTGKPSGPIGFVPGLVGQAFQFDGHSVLDLSTNSPSVLGARATSMTLYLKIEPSSRDATIAEASEGNRRWRLRIDEARLASFEYSSSTGTPIRLQSKRAVETGIWTHLAIVFGLNELSLYVDGVLSDSHAVAYLGRNPFAIRLGGPLETKDTFLNAQVDELYFFSEALSAKQVKSLYEVRRASPCSP